MFDPGMAWADVDDIRKRWKGTFLLKGLVHPDEARRAVDHGVDGIIVSNHGGRQLDGTTSPFEALPAVVEAVGGRIPVLIDGGIRRGADVVKALCLGASAALIGRPNLWGLAVGGEAGVGACARDLPERDRPGDGPPRRQPHRRPRTAVLGRAEVGDAVSLAAAPSPLPPLPAPPRRSPAMPPGARPAPPAT